MLTARNFVATAVVIAVLSILSTCWSMLRPRDGGGLRPDSFGIYQSGHRALYDTLTELHVPVSRSTAPPDGDRLNESLLILWAPSVALVKTEPRWLMNLKDWVSDGGEMIVAYNGRPQMTFEDLLSEEIQKLSPRSGNDSKKPSSGNRSSRLETESAPSGENEILKILGLPAVSIRPVAPSVDQDSGSDEDRWQGSISGSVHETEKPEISDSEPAELQSFCTRGTGIFKDGIGHGRQIELPRDLLDVVDAGNEMPADAIFIEGPSLPTAEDEENRQCIAARFPVGQGWITIVSTPQLISNARIGSADHIAVISALLLNSGRSIVFDEFYHGATIRGNPLWLLTHRSYLLTGMALIILSITVLWRKAVFPGPALMTPPVSRRSIGEYIDAMSAFRRRTRNHPEWTLRQVNDGILWRLRREYGLPADQKNPEPLLVAMHRDDPTNADSLQKLLNEVDTLTRSTKAVSERQTAPLMKRMTECLSKTAIKRSATKLRK